MRGFTQAVTIAGLLLTISIGGTAWAEDVKLLDPAGGQAAGAMTAVTGQGGLAGFLASQGWVNQSGSVMNFTFTSGGMITGSYINNAPGTGCQGSVYPLTGFINGNNIAWSVAWDNATANCNSVTAWAGYYDSNVGGIVTNWSLAFLSGSGGAIQNGSDTFIYK